MKTSNTPLSDELNKIADLLEKQAGLFSIGDEIVCLNPVEGIVKGQKYHIKSFPQPGYVAVEDIYGNEIGCFSSSRFCLDNKEY